MVSFIVNDRRIKLLGGDVIRIAPVIAILLVVASCALVPLSPGTIDSESVVGVVTDVQGTPIGGALILAPTSAGSMWGPPIYRIRRHATTNSDGTFEIKPDPKSVSNTANPTGRRPGYQSFTIMHPDYSAIKVIVTKRNERYEFSVTLEVDKFTFTDDKECFEFGPEHCLCIKKYMQTLAWKCDVEVSGNRNDIFAK